jgi:hypothetical protein
MSEESTAQTSIAHLTCIEDVVKLRAAISEASLERGMWVLVYRPNGDRKYWDFTISNTWCGKVKKETAVAALKIAEDLGFTLQT